MIAAGAGSATRSWSPRRLGALSADGDLTVDVNEQNTLARGFYEALGFEVITRSPHDDDGRPFPVRHVRRSTGRESPSSHVE